VHHSSCFELPVFQFYFPGLLADANKAVEHEGFADGDREDAVALAPVSGPLAPRVNDEF